MRDGVLCFGVDCEDDFVDLTCTHRLAQLSTCFFLSHLHIHNYRSSPQLPFGKVVVYTDNKILLANVRNCREITNQVELRKLITISQLVNEIHHIETARNKIADYLSRAEFRCETVEGQYNFEVYPGGDLEDDDVIVTVQ